MKVTAEIEVDDLDEKVGEQIVRDAVEGSGLLDISVLNGVPTITFACLLNIEFEKPFIEVVEQYMDGDCWMYEEDTEPGRFLLFLRKAYQDWEEAEKNRKTAA